jgi:hypothetical protein
MGNTFGPKILFLEKAHKNEIKSMVYVGLNHGLIYNVG